jgi:3-hydroxyisobutyrate dehydrogenase-like beta-hydroxyacid dehydrogenase
MAPLPPYGLKVPILLGGARAAELVALLAPAGMKFEIVADDIGTASAIKMCRSVMIKGMEALVVECLLGARHYGVEDRVLASLEETFPQMKWDERADYLVSRVVVHGRRRAAEMREVAVTIREAGLEPFMASATAECQDRISDIVDAGAGSRVMTGDFSWRTFADAVAALREIRSVAASQ